MLSPPSLHDLLVVTPVHRRPLPFLTHVSLKTGHVNVLLPDLVLWIHRLRGQVVIGRGAPTPSTTSIYPLQPRYPLGFSFSTTTPLTRWCTMGVNNPLRQGYIFKSRPTGLFLCLGPLTSVPWSPRSPGPGPAIGLRPILVLPSAVLRLRWPTRPALPRPPKG